MEIKNNLRLQKRIVEFRNSSISASLEYMSCKIAASNINCKIQIFGNILEYLDIISIMINHNDELVNVITLFIKLKQS